MLNQQKVLFTAKTRFVNKALNGAVLTGMTLMASTHAHAWSADNIIQTKHAVKISMAELKTETGVEKTYAKLKQKAHKSCAVGTSVDNKGDIQTKSACTADLLSQFVQSAALDALTDYHKARLSNVKIANFVTR